MRQRTVIPMSFGTVFKTRDDIVELLRGAYDAFRDVLNKMEDKLEFGLKILWDRDVMIREIEKQDEDVRRLKGEIATQKDRPTLPASSTAGSSTPRWGPSASATCPRSSRAP